MLKGTAKRTVRTRIVDEATRHVGYRAQPERRSAFQVKEYTGKPWNGTFVDRVLSNALGGSAEVRFISTVTALSYYLNRNGVYRKPREGDVVFFGFASDPLQAFEQPHVGIVTDTGRWKTDGSFRTVEGETGPGVPQGSQLVDGVFERVRYSTDVLGFVRPDRRTVRKITGESTPLKLSYFDSNGKTVARAVETVQVALNTVRPSWTFNRGKRDGTFKSVLGLYARERGMVTHRGEIEPRVLGELSSESNLKIEI